MGPLAHGRATEFGFRFPSPAPLRNQIQTQSFFHHWPHVPREGIRKILDLGFRHGNTSRLLAAQFPDAEDTGVEYDANRVALARGRVNNPRIRFEPGDETSLRFADGSFDLVLRAICCGTFPSRIWWSARLKVLPTRRSF
jgi:ubiquinone/menaquinone biosynthesis C-methylase UbiE